MRFNFLHGLPVEPRTAGSIGVCQTLSSPRSGLREVKGLAPRGLYFTFALGRVKIEPGIHCLRMHEKCLSFLHERGRKEA